MKLLITKVNILVILVVYISRDTTAEIIEDLDSLQLVTVLHRHGHRTPDHTYTNDPYKDVEKYWPIGLGQLTNKGKLQLYNLGKLFRKEYKSFLPKYSFKAVRVNSSDYDRTHMSTQCLLAGWFRPEGDQIWNDEIAWQPIAVHSVPTNKDQTLAPLAPCPRFWMEREKVLMELASKETAEDKELYEYLTEKSGDKISTIDDVASLYTNLQMEEFNHYPLPEWTKGVYPEKMQEKTETCGISFTWNKILKKFYGGSLVKEMFHQFHEKSKGGNADRKLFVYSAHDTTIISFLRALDFEKFKIPDFGASVILELHKLYNQYYLKIFYSHAAELVPYELQFPNCTIPCPLERALENTEYVRSGDWNTDCFK
ncbi:prostatic acid phosphatase-like [Lycorma delicatula]|uniref:prostatic acid phosphatase-like n=1 Tax=Lycorma delicatula TaxID=130591 RepID=UPI003F515CAE